MSGINRYEHVPEYNTPILPYDLIMKAADIKQQRWDKASATAQENFNDVFSKTKAIASSEDERLVLPALREQFNSELSKMVNDPSMTAEQLSISANGLVGRMQPTLDRVNQAYTLHTTSLAEKMKNEANAEWSSTNQYVGEPDLFNWNSTKNSDFSKLNYESRTSIDPVMKPYWDKWEKSTLGTKTVMGPDGKAYDQEITGKDFKGLANLAELRSFDYMNTNNFSQWRNDMKGVVPDDVLKNTAGFTTTFGGKKFEELSKKDQAKAMIMMHGAQQIDYDVSKLAGSTGKGNSSGTGDMGYTNNPWFLFEETKNAAPSEMGLVLGMENYDPTTNSFRGITAGNEFFNTPATVSTFGTPKEAATASIVQDLAKDPNTAGVLTILEQEIPNLEAANADVAKQAAALKGIDLYGDNGYTMKATRAALKSLPETSDAKKAIAKYEQQKNALDQKMESAFQDLKKSSGFLDAQRAALKAGIDLNSAQGIKSLLEDYKSIKTKMAKDQVSNLGTAIIGLGGYDWVPQTGNNVVNIEDRKFVKGSMDIPANFDLLDETLVPVLQAQGWNVATSGYSWAPDVGTPNIETLFEDLISTGKMSKVVKGDGREYYRIPMNLEVPMNDPQVVNRYNMAKAGSDAILKAQLPTWQQEFSDLRAQKNTAELANRLVQDPKALTEFTNGINNFVQNYAGIDRESKNSIVSALADLNKSYATHPNLETAKSIIQFQNTISQYVQNKYSKESLMEYLDHLPTITNGNASTPVNPNQPQRPTSNPLGIAPKK